MSDTEFEFLADAGLWQPGFEQRLRTDYAASGYPEGAIEHALDRIRDRLAGWQLAGITASGCRVGFVAVGVAEENGATLGRIGDLWVDPAHRGHGYEQQARRWAERWCRERGAQQVTVRLTHPDPLFADYPVRGQTRLRAVSPDTGPLDGITARPMTEAEYPAWLAAGKDAYIADIVRSGALSPAEARQKSDRDFDRLLPGGVSTPGHAILILEAEGEPVGTGWLHHGLLPGVTFGYSLDIHPEHRGKGYGRAAMAAGELATRRAGDSALMFNVFGGNEVAINLYTSAGFRVAEEHRSLDLG